MADSVAQQYPTAPHSATGALVPRASRRAEPVRRAVPRPGRDGCGNPSRAWALRGAMDVAIHTRFPRWIPESIAGSVRWIRESIARTRRATGLELGVVTVGDRPAGHA
jgi:hypothetical protein